MGNAPRSLSVSPFEQALGETDDHDETAEMVKAFVELDTDGEMVQ